MNIYTLYEGNVPVFSGTNRECTKFAGAKQNSNLNKAAEHGRGWFGYFVRVTGYVEAYKYYSIFDLSGNRIMTGTANAISKALKIHSRNIRPACDKGYIICGKYTVIKADPPDVTPKEFKELPEKLTGTSEPYEFKGTKMMLHKNWKGELIKTTFLPLQNN